LIAGQGTKNMDTSIAYLIGLVIVLALFSVVGAVLIRLGANLITKESVGFGTAFWISFAAFGVGLISQKIFDGVAGPVPAMAIFGTSWLLSANVITYGTEKKKSYGKALALTAVQFLGLMMIAAVIAVSFIALK
jgi:hypothetical protein